MYMGTFSISSSKKYSSKLLSPATSLLVSAVLSVSVERTWRFRILITKRYTADIPSFLLRWSLLAAAANARVVKVVAYLCLII